MKLQLNDIELHEDGSKIIYRYSYDSVLSDYFSTDILYIEYHGLDLKAVPYSLLVIPFLGNMLPVSWFIGFDIVVKEVDVENLDAVFRIKQEFTKNYHRIRPDDSKLIYSSTIRNHVRGTKPAVLFSGGVDSLTTYLKHRTDNPLLLTVLGADIRFNDNRKLAKLKSFIETAPVLSDTRKIFITSNLRTFYRYRLNLIFDDFDWWGRVQHGLALISLVAPLTSTHGVNILYISSSVTGEYAYPWGSDPAIDNEVKWSNFSTIHDSYELNRLQKIQALVDYSRQSGKRIPVKVCYSNKTSQLNCSHCEKCLRTILLIILCGDDPSKYGFVTRATVYDEILHAVSRGFATEMAAYQWQVVRHGILNTKTPYIIKDENAEHNKLQQIARRIEQNEASGLIKMSQATMIRRKLQLRLPAVYQLLIRLSPSRLFSRYIKGK